MGDFLSGGPQGTCHAVQMGQAAIHRSGQSQNTPATRTPQGAKQHRQSINRLDESTRAL
jgi:hypothetical protein